MNIGPNFFGVGSGSGDPDFASVVLLLHADGTDGSTTFVDASSKARSPTGQSGVTLSTAQSKFGASSIKFANRDQYIQYKHADFIPTIGVAMTIEAWIYWSSTPNIAGMPILRLQSAGGYMGLDFYGNTGKIQFATNAFGDETSPYTIAANAWKHVAMVKKSNDLCDTYYDGVKIFSDINCGFDSPDTSFYIGYPATSNSMLVYVDEVRVTRGVARYSANFTPPAAPFPDA